MADLNIPNLNIKPDKYIFKKKLNLRRKSKRRLFTESFFLFILSVLLVYVNYLIPNKNLLLQNLPSTFNKSFLLLIDLFSYLYEIFLVIFIFVSSFTALILMIGSINRLFKVSKRKSKIVYKLFQIGCIRPPLPESESSSSYSVSSPNNANMPSTIDERIIDKGKIEVWIPMSIYSPIN